jgi:protein involved in polysaccharide export with SLBB domain
VGVINVNDISLNEAKTKITDYISMNVLQNAVIDITLLDLKRFKIQLLGAVYYPGYIYVSGVDRIYDVIKQGGGMQKYANQSLIQVKREGKILDINLVKYLTGDDLSQNISLKPGDVVFVPFNDYAVRKNFNTSSLINDKIIVYGFVNRTSSGSSFEYYPGYTVRDYIALAGGTKEQNSSFNAGNIQRVKLYRTDGTKVKNALNELVMPGDIIEVPPSLLYQIVGGDGVIRTLASIASSAYIVYKFTQE